MRIIAPPFRPRLSIPLPRFAYSYQTFSVGQVLTAAQVQQIEDNVRDHQHGIDGVSGGVALLTSGSVANAASLALTSLITDDHDVYLLLLTDWSPATDNVALYMTLSADNGSNYATTGYQYSRMQHTSAGADEGQVAGANAAQFELANALSNVADENLTASITFSRSAGTHFYAEWREAHVNASTAAQHSTGGAVLRTNAINALKLAMSSGNITSGDYRLYGLN